MPLREAQVKEAEKNHLVESSKENLNGPFKSHKILEIEKLNDFYLTFLQKKVFWNIKTEAFSNSSQQLRGSAEEEKGTPGPSYYLWTGTNQSNTMLWFNNQNLHQVFHLNFLEEETSKRSIPGREGKENFTTSLNQKNFQSSQIFENCPKKILPIFMKTDFPTINFSASQKNFIPLAGFKPSIGVLENLKIQKFQPIYFYYKAKLLLETNFKNSFFDSLATSSSNKSNLEREKSKNRKLLRKLKNQEKFFFKNVRGSKILNNFEKFYLSPVLSPSLQDLKGECNYVDLERNSRINIPGIHKSGNGKSLSDSRGIHETRKQDSVSLKFLMKKFHSDLNFFLFFKTKNSKLFQILKKQIPEKQKINKVKKLEQFILNPTLEKFSGATFQKNNLNTSSKKKFLFYLMKMTNFSKKINELNKFLILNSDVQLPSNESKAKFKNFTYKFYLLNKISHKGAGFLSYIPFGEKQGQKGVTPTNKEMELKKRKANKTLNFAPSRLSATLWKRVITDRVDTWIVEKNKTSHFPYSKNQTIKLSPFIRSGTFFQNQTFSSIFETKTKAELSSNLWGISSPSSKGKGFLSIAELPAGHGYELNTATSLEKLNSKAGGGTQNQFLFFLQKLLNEFLNLWTSPKSYLNVLETGPKLVYVNNSKNFVGLNKGSFDCSPFLSSSPENMEREALNQKISWAAKSSKGTPGPELEFRTKKKFLIPQEFQGNSRSGTRVPDKILNKKNKSSVLKKEKIFRTLLSSKSVLKDETISLSTKLEDKSSASLLQSNSTKFSKLSNQEKKDFFVKTLKQLKMMESEPIKGQRTRDPSFLPSRSSDLLLSLENLTLSNSSKFTDLDRFIVLQEKTNNPIKKLVSKKNKKKVNLHKFSLNQRIQKVGFVFYGQKELDLKKDSNFFKNQKYFQKKRRRKKLKLENRRRKKRKRFYPRPVWLRYNLYRQFLNLRSNKSFQRKKMNFLIKFKTKLDISGNSGSSFPLISGVGEGQNTRSFLQTKRNSFKAKKSDFVFKKFSSLNSIYRNNKQKWGNFVLDTNLLEKNLVKKFVLAWSYSPHLPIYSNKNNSQITNQILNDFMPLYWKSYWLRTNLTPYMNRIKKNLNLQKSLAFQQESTEFSYNQTFLSHLLGFFSAALNSGLMSESLKLGATDKLKTELIHSAVSFYSNKKPSFEKFSDFSVSNSELVEKMRLIREHDKILFERISEIVKNVKYNMNLDGENSIKSYKLPKGKYNGLINNISQNGQRRPGSETNSLANTLRSSMFQQLDPNFSLFSAFNGASVSTTGTLFKPYGSNATLRVLWAFNKTNLFSFKEKNSIKNLWETYKNREQSKSNQTKKFFKKTFTNISKNAFIHSADPGIWSSAFSSAPLKSSNDQLRMLYLFEKQIPNFLQQKNFNSTQDFQRNSSSTNKRILSSEQIKGLRKKNYLNKITLEKMLRSAESHRKKLYYSSNVANKKFFYFDPKNSFKNFESFSANFIPLTNKTYFKRVVKGGSNASPETFKNQRNLDSFPPAGVVTKNGTPGQELSYSSLVDGQKLLLKKSSVFFWWSNKNFGELWSGASFMNPFFINSSVSLTFGGLEEVRQGDNRSRGEQIENSFFLKFIWSFSILFHLCILINFLKIPELRNLLKFQFSLIYKISNIYFIPLFYFYNSVKLAGKNFFFFCFPKPAESTNKIETVFFHFYNKNFYSKQIQKVQNKKKQYSKRFKKFILEPSLSESSWYAFNPLRDKSGSAPKEKTISRKFRFFIFNNIKIYKFISLSDILVARGNSNAESYPSYLDSYASVLRQQMDRAFLERRGTNPPQRSVVASRIESYERHRLLGTKLSLLVSKISKVFVVLGLNSVQFIYKILLQGISFVESILVFIYKFLEKPAELMVESIAQIFLIEWISDISTFLPETLDKNLWQSFQKLSRPTRLMSLFLAGPSVRNQQLGLQNNVGFLTSLPFSFLFLNTFKFYSMEIWQFLLKPDMDIYSRQKRGIYFMNIWGEIFVQAAEKYQMNATSLATNNVEQEKFLERLLKDPEIFSELNPQGYAMPSTKNSKIQKDFYKLFHLENEWERNQKFSQKEQLFVRLRKAIERGENSFASFPVNQHIIASCFGALAYATTERDLFLDISPPKSFSSSNPFCRSGTGAYLNSPVSFILGPLVCEVYSGLFSKKVSKNILLIPSLNESNVSSSSKGITDWSSHGQSSSSAPLSKAQPFIQSLELQKNKTQKKSMDLGNALIQALAGETEMKLIIDNAKRYAANFHNKAIGIRLLKDVFMSIALQTPSFFLMEDIHFIGEKRPMLIGNFADENSGSEIINFEQDEAYFQNLFNSRQKTLTYKRFSSQSGTDSSFIPSNFFNKHFFTYKNNKVYKSFGSNLSKEFSNSNQFLNSRTNSKKQKRHPGFKSKPFEQNFNSSGKAEGLSFKNSLVSRLQKQSEEFFAPPSTSPFTILLMKDQNKLKGTKSHFIPWTLFKNQKNNVTEGASASQNQSISSNKTIRSKIAELADITLRNFSVSIDMITDLLVIVDSVRSNRGFVVFATTPIPSVLDPALRRPGRFDETLCLPDFSMMEFAPGANSMNPESQIFKIHKKSLSQYTFQNRFYFQKFGVAESWNEISGASFFERSSKILRFSKANPITKEGGVTNRLVAKKTLHTSTMAQIKRSEKQLKKLNQKTVRKKLTKIFFLTSSLISDFLIQTDLLKNQPTKYFNQTFQYHKNSDQLTVLFLLFSSTSQYKDLIALFLAPKVVEFFYSSGKSALCPSMTSLLPASKEAELSTRRGGHFLSYAELSERQGTQRIFYNLTDSTNSTDFIFSILQKRYLFQKNFIVSKLLMENTSYSLKEPPGPPISEILMPAKKYEAFKASEKDFIFKNSFSIYEKLHSHQKQRFLKKLYNQPVQIYFKSLSATSRRSGTDFNDFTTFVNSFKELGSVYSKSSGASANSTQILRNISSTNYYYKTRFLMRHRFSITNQWSNAQLPEHNAESTFLSDVDWRSMYVQSLQEKKLSDTNQKIVQSVENVDTQKDYKIDFTDAEQYYNPRIRKWILKSSMNSIGGTALGLSAELKQPVPETIFTYEIYYHFLMQAFYKTYNYFDKNRELLDYFVFKYLLKGSLLELNSIFMLTRFYKK
jgi:hypothetical protein